MVIERDHFRTRSPEQAEYRITVWMPCLYQRTVGHLTVHNRGSGARTGPAAVIVAVGKTHDERKTIVKSRLDDIDLIIRIRTMLAFIQRAIRRKGQTLG